MPRPYVLNPDGTPRQKEAMLHASTELQVSSQEETVLAKGVNLVSTSAVRLGS
jgi:hypothetical protein